MAKTKYNEKIKRFRSGEERPLKENATWTPKELAKLAGKYERGEDISKIAATMERSETAVMQKLISMGCCDQATTRRKRSDDGECSCICNKCKLKGTKYCKLNATEKCEQCDQIIEIE